MSTKTNLHDPLASVVEALAEDRFQVREDAFVKNPEDLVPLISTRRVGLMRPPLLDDDQSTAIGEMAALIDKARSKYEAMSSSRGRGLADQHRIARGREASFLVIAGMLSDALRTAGSAGLELRITVDRVGLMDEGVMVARAILRVLPSRAAYQAA